MVLGFISGEKGSDNEAYENQRAHHWEKSNKALYSRLKPIFCFVYSTTNRTLQRSMPLLTGHKARYETNNKWKYNSDKRPPCPPSYCRKKGEEHNMKRCPNTREDLKEKLLEDYWRSKRASTEPVSSRTRGNAPKVNPSGIASLKDSKTSVSPTVFENSLPMGEYLQKCWPLKGQIRICYPQARLRGHEKCLRCHPHKARASKCIQGQISVCMRESHEEGTAECIFKNMARIVFIV